MSVYIKGVEKPTDGFITVTITSDGRVVGNSQKINGKFEYLDNKDIASAVPVPDHGRLIDADALEDEAITYYALPALANAMDSEAELVLRLREIDSAPTIIPADPAEEGEG